MYFEVYQSGIQWRWRLRAANHQIIAHGESYHNRTDCYHVVGLVKGSSNAPIKEL